MRWLDAIKAARVQLYIYRPQRTQKTYRTYLTTQSFASFYNSEFENYTQLFNNKKVKPKKFHCI